MAEYEDSCNNTLHYICSVKAIHAICSDNPFLFFEDANLSLITFSNPDIALCMRKSTEYNRYLINQFGEIIPFHISALMMEVKPNIVCFREANAIVHIREIVSNQQLIILLVDEINNQVLTILRFDCFHMVAECSSILLFVRLD